MVAETKIKVNTTESIHVTFTLDRRTLNVTINEKLVAEYAGVTYLEMHPNMLAVTVINNAAEVRRIKTFKPLDFCVRFSCSITLVLGIKNRYN